MVVGLSMYDLVIFEVNSKRFRDHVVNGLTSCLTQLARDVQHWIVDGLYRNGSVPRLFAHQPLETVYRVAYLNLGHLRMNFGDPNQLSALLVLSFEQAVVDRDVEHIRRQAVLGARFCSDLASIRSAIALAHDFNATDTALVGLGPR